MKKFLALALSFAMVLAVGCTNNASGDQVAPTGEKQVGGIVRTTMPSEPDNLDPHLSAAADTEAVMNNVFEGLIRFDEKGEFLPQLASDYKVSDDGLNYTFDIRTDVTFHNGEPMTMEDVIYSYTRLSGINGEQPLSSKFQSVSSIEAVDEDTLTFTLTQPDAAFLSTLIEPVIPADYADQSRSPIGTGPFAFVSYTPGQSIALKRNDTYYDSNRMATINEINFRIMTDESSIVMALKAGDLDIAQVLSMSVPAVEKDFEISSFPQNMVQIFAFNHAIAPFDNLKVRQAINYAINKDLIIDGVVGGYGSKLYTNASPVMGFWFNDLSANDPYPYNPELAKQLLAQAGYANGFETTIKVPSNYQTHIDTAQVLADMLSQVGITLNIELIEWGQWLETVYSGGTHDTTIIGLAGKLDPHEIFVRFQSAYAKNFYHFKNEAYDTLITDGIHETDPNKRADIYKQAQQFLADEAVAVFIMDPHLIMASKPNLKGYAPYPAPYFDATKLYYVGE
ncbi:ABC transporter substrate-binding protein [Niameybacter sp.]|uniref:ABC transporter substrate-binding protein n=1 Tax=Niameybacter sp. TaxID=2033640 RepID=UPI002FC6C6EF